MQAVRPWWLALAALASFFVIGIPYWRIPYDDLTLPNALLTPWLLLAIALALWLSLARAAPVWLAAAMVTVMVVAVVIVRIGVDTAHDPTSHNLWPFETVIALALGILAAVPVILIGTIGGKLLARRGGPG